MHRSLVLLVSFGSVFGAAALPTEGACPSEDPGIRWERLAYESETLGPDFGSVVLESGNVWVAFGFEGPSGPTCAVEEWSKDGTVLTTLLSGELDGYTNCRAMAPRGLASVWVAAEEAATGRDHMFHVYRAGNEIRVGPIYEIPGTHFDRIEDVVPIAKGAVAVGWNDTHGVVWRHSTTALDWTFQADGKFFAGDVGTDGRILATGENSIGTMQTFSLTPDGTVDWVDYYTADGPTVGRDVTYGTSSLVHVVGGSPTQLVVRTLWFGEELWTHVESTPGGADGSGRYVAVGPDGTVFAAASNEPGSSQTSVLYTAALDFGDGTELWEYARPGPGGEDAAIGLQVDPENRVRVGFRSVETAPGESSRTGLLGLCGDAGALLSDFVHPDLDMRGKASALHPDGVAIVVSETDTTADLLAPHVMRVGEPTNDGWRIGRAFLDGPRWVHPGDPPREWNFFDDTRDGFSFHAREGRTYTITVDAVGSALDAVGVKLFDSDQATELRSANSSRFPPRARIEWTAQRSGLLHVEMNNPLGTSGPNREYRVELTGSTAPSRLGVTTLTAGDRGRFLAAAALRDGGGVAVGHTGTGAPGTPPTDSLAVKFAPDGSIEWQHAFEAGDPALAARATAVTQRSDGVVAVAVTIDSDPPTGAVLLLDPADGTPSAIRSLDYLLAGSLSAIEPLPGGHLLLAGQVRESGMEPFVARVDENFDVVWAHRFVEMSTDPSQALDLATIRHGGFFVLIDRLNGADNVVARFDESGTWLWSRSYDDPTLTAFEIEPLRGGGFALGGFDLGGTTGDENVWVAAMDAVGKPLWSRTLAWDGDERVVGLVADDDEGVLAAVNAVQDPIRDGWVLAFDANGAMRYARGVDVGTDDHFDAIVLDDAGAPQIVGHAQDDPWTLVLDRDGAAADGCSAVYTLDVGGFEARVLETDVHAYPPDPVAPVATDESMTRRATGYAASASCEVALPPEASPGGGPGAGLRWATRIDLNWDGAAEADTYALYRGDVAELSMGSTGACEQAGLVEPAAVVSGAPETGEGWFFLVTNVNELGAGSMGTRTDETMRPFPTPACDGVEGR